MSNTGKTYTEDFRRDAVELFRSSGRPISQIACELGVNINSLCKWRNCILSFAADVTYNNRLSMITPSHDVEDGIFVCNS